MAIYQGRGSLVPQVNPQNFIIQWDKHINSALNNATAVAQTIQRSQMQKRQLEYMKLQEETAQMKLEQAKFETELLKEQTSNLKTIDSFVSDYGKDLQYLAETHQFGPFAELYNKARQDERASIRGAMDVFNGILNTSKNEKPFLTDANGDVQPNSYFYQQAFKNVSPEAGIPEPATMQEQAQTEYDLSITRQFGEAAGDIEQAKTYESKLLAIKSKDDYDNYVQNTPYRKRVEELNKTSTLLKARIENATLDFTNKNLTERFFVEANELRKIYSLALQDEEVRKSDEGKVVWNNLRALSGKLNSELATIDKNIIGTQQELAKLGNMKQTEKVKERTGILQENLKLLNESRVMAVESSTRLATFYKATGTEIERRALARIDGNNVSVLDQNTGEYKQVDILSLTPADAAKLNLPVDELETLKTNIRAEKAAKLAKEKAAEEERKLRESVNIPQYMRANPWASLKRL